MREEVPKKNGNYFIAAFLQFSILFSVETIRIFLGVFDIEEMVGSRSGLSCAVERNVARSHIVERVLVGMSWVESEEATSVHRELTTGGEYSAVDGKGRSQMGRKNNRVGNIHQENPPKR